MAGISNGQPLFLSLMPTEIRLRIYGEVLQLDHPVTKCPVEPPKEDDVLPPVHGQFGLLFVNKQIAREALSVLYETNTLSISHLDLCAPSNTTPPLDRSLVEHIQIRHEPASDSWMHCLSCALVDGLLDHILTEGHFPRLKTVFILFDHNWTDVEEARKRLQRKGLDLEFTHVGRCRITGLPPGLNIRFEHTALAAAWEYVAGLPTREGHSDGAGLHDEPPPLLREGLGHPHFDISPVIVSDICTLFHAYRGRHSRSIERFPGPFRRTRSGLRHEWMEPENQDARVLEFITVSLERAGRSKYLVEWA